ncbi:MAG: ABC transporter permease [Candidatus Portnoybacteria bacterium]|nr:ABC transporter permease [Candidatus Portnoybacteria bacterium]MDD4983031.1 ABC transporter permease [Candidatus Portnoybacteria bacterium]
MAIFDLLEEIYFALSANKIRSFLTVLGIVIGIGSVIAMVSIGQGAQGSIQSSIQSIGSNLVIVTPGAQRGVGVQVSAGRGSAQTLTQADADAIQKEISSIKQIAPELTRRYQITAKGQNTNTSITGTTPAYPEVRNIAVGEGSFIDAQQMASYSKVAVIGPTVRDDLFGQGAEALGQSIKINGVIFKIVGITQAKGGSGFNNPDDIVYVPLTTAQRFLAGDAYVTTISIEAQDQSSMASVQQQITILLLERHKISDPAAADFGVLTQADIVATASTVTSTFTILLASIAGISLLVGGIGIMNMMLTTVTERTREIGLRKAIGAKKRDINLQFLMEAITLTFLGGMIGVGLGWLLAYLVSLFAGIATSVSWSSVFLAFGVSAAIGVVFGYYPARRASQLNPIEALRYE